jgi:predicted ATPase/class 3 adenylate cyclase/Tfp pilus assembly protein PilF
MESPAPEALSVDRAVLGATPSGPRPVQTPEGQRRDVTILIADLTDYTATIHDLDPEDAYSLVADYLAILGRTVLEYEGTVHRYTGDGVIALFGAPEAHEDDPERALRAALDMQAAVAQFRPKWNTTATGALRIRVGVHRGTVIVGALGTDGAREYTVIGETVNLASRLESAAQPGSTLVSAPIYQHTWPLFDFEPQPPLMVKGLPEPIDTYRLIGPRARPGRMRGVPGLHAPMIGRDRPYEQLQATLAALIQEQRGQVVFVSGDAGVGKTRLVSELRTYVSSHWIVGSGQMQEDGRGALKAVPVDQRSSITWLEGRCMDYERTQAYGPFAQALTAGLGISAAADEDHRLKEIAAALEESGGAAGRALVPYFAFLLSAGPSGGALPDSISHLGPLTAQQQTFAAVRQYLQWEAAKRPLVLLLDDLHWLDELSRELLISLLDLCERLPILFFCISREEGERGHLHLIRRAAHLRVPEHITAIGLEPLSDEDCGRLIDHLLSNPAPPPPLRQGIVDRALGNPFFVEEILRMLIDRGQLVQGDPNADTEGAWVLAPGAAETVEGVPGTLGALILTRFDRLAQPLQATLQGAAVLGVQFGFAELSAMLHLPEAELRRHLSELVAREFLVREPSTASTIAEDAYAFKHPLTQEAVYSTLLKRHRRALHRAAGEALERLYTGRVEAQAQNLARHFEECEQPQKAGPYLLIAAERAAARYANDQAVAYFERARKALASAGGEPWAIGSSGALADTAAVTRRIATGLGTVFQLTGRYNDALYELYDALKLISATDEDRVEQADLMIRVAATHDRLGEFPEAVAWYQWANESAASGPAARAKRAEIAFGTGQTYFNLGQYEHARRYIRHSLGLVAGTSHYAEQAQAYHLLGGICFRTDDRAGALHYTRRALALREAMGHTVGIAGSYISQGILLWLQGQRAEALRSLERAVHLCQDIGDAHGLRSALANLGQCYLRLGQLDRAHEVLQRGLTLVRRMGNVPGAIRMQLNLVLVYLEGGDLAQSDELLADALRQAEEISSQEHMAEAYELSARLYIARADADAALDAAARALEIAVAMRSVEHQANAYRTRAAAHRLRADWAGADAAIAQSLAACDQMGDPHLLALTLREQGRLLLDQAQAGDGDALALRDQAREKLETARDLFAREEAARALQDVQVLLREIDRGSRTEDGNDRSPVLGPPSEARRWRDAAVLAVRLTLADDAAGGDAEPQYELLQEAMPVLLEAAVRFGGAPQMHHDGFTIVFGAPSAQENAPERALRAGLALQTALDAVNRRLAQHNGVRLALAQAVAGGPIVMEDQIVIGASLQSADRLVQRAAPGAILVTPPIRDAAARVFDFEPALSANGHHGDDQPYRLIRAHPARRGLSLAGGEPILHVGRDAEVAALHQILALTRETGVGHVVVIQGEAGIGKSRLVAEALRADGGQWTIGGQVSTVHRLRSTVKVVTARAYAHTQGIAYAALAELVCDVLGVTPGTAAQEVRARLDECLPPDAPEAVRDSLLYILGQLGARTSGPLDRLDAAQMRQQMFIALRTLLLAAAATQPLAVLFEDAHWLDSASMDALFFLLGVIEQAPILVCCLLRTEEAGRHSRILTVAARLCPGRMLHLTLQPLSPEHIEQLAQLLLEDREPRPGDLRPRSISRIVSRADGNPLFLEELVTLLTSQNGAPVIVPRSVSALVLSRLDHLPAAQQRLAEAAAVLGRSFDANLIEQMLGEEVAAGDLDKLHNQGLIEPTDLPGAYQFRHGLMQEAIYESLGKRRRARWHRLAGELLERLAGDHVERHAEMLGHHFLQADLPERALPYLLIAGRKAAESYANEAAAAAFAQARALLERVAEVADLDRWAVHIGLADALTATGDHRGALGELETLRDTRLADAVAPHLRSGLYRRLAKSAERAGDAEGALAALELARSALSGAGDDDARLERAQIELTLGWALFRQGQTEAARGAALAALDAAEELANFNVIAAACNLLGGLAYTSGDLGEAVALSERSLALRREIGDALGVAAAYSNLGVLAVTQGQWDQAVEHFERSLAMRHEAGDLAGEAVVLSNLGQIMKDRGDLARAVEHFTASLRAAQRTESAYQQVVNRSNLGHLTALRGDGAGAVRALTESIQQAEAIGARDLVAEAHWMLAEAQLVRDDVPAAASAATRALELAGAIDHWRHAAHARCMLGRAALHSGDCLGAALQLRAALHIARQLGDQLVLAMVYDEWAELRTRSLRPERAWRWRQRAQQLYGGLKLN